MPTTHVIPRSFARRWAPVAIALAATVASGCTPVGGKRYSRQQAEKSLAKLDKPGVIVGEFRVSKIVDGDTIWVDGIDASLRLLGIDTEETFKHEDDCRDVEADWNAYLANRRGTRLRPAKLATPLGEQAKEYAKKFFAGIDHVRIERDDPAEIRDAYDRYLAYVVAQKNGKWVVYNVECVRAGMAPYFTKYGFSRRYHKEFLEAEKEAKAAKIGIWEPGAMHDPDYPEREEWWNARGNFVQKFRDAGKGKDNYIDISHWNALQRIEDHVGKEVHILGVVDKVVRNTRGPARVTLSRSRKHGGGFPLIFFDRDILGTSGLTEWRGEYVVATGIPTFYTNKHTGRKQLQLQIDRASQIELSPVPKLTPPSIPTTTAAGTPEAPTPPAHAP